MRKYSDLNKSRILKKIAMLLRWFDECTITTIGDADYMYLVQKLINDEIVSYENSDLFLQIFMVRSITKKST